MIKKTINQNHNFDLELLKSIGYSYIFNNEPIDRSKNKINNTDKSEEDKIKKLIMRIEEIYLEVYIKKLKKRKNQPP